jgi:hypothetical protein
MYDARTFPNTLENARRVLGDKEAVFKGEYFIHDVIFSSLDPEETLDKVFLRLRLLPKNIWNEKDVIVTIKNTETKQIGKQSVIPVKEQFDTETEARKFIEERYSGVFQYSFEFDRKGWQYDFANGDQVDLEEVEGHPSIEFKSKTEEGLGELLGAFGVRAEEVITGPSVVAVKDILKNQR